MSSIRCVVDWGKRLPDFKSRRPEGVDAKPSTQHLSFRTPYFRIGVTGGERLVSGSGLQGASDPDPGGPCGGLSLRRLLTQGLDYSSNGAAAGEAETGAVSSSAGTASFSRTARSTCR